MYFQSHLIRDVVVSLFYLIFWSKKKKILLVTFNSKTQKRLKWNNNKKKIFTKHFICISISGNSMFVFNAMLSVRVSMCDMGVGLMGSRYSTLRCRYNEEKSYIFLNSGLKKRENVTFFSSYAWVPSCVFLHLLLTSI